MALREHLSQSAAMADDGDGDMFDDSPDDPPGKEAAGGGDAATMKCGSCGQVIMGADGEPRAPGSEAHNCKWCSRPLHDDDSAAINAVCDGGYFARWGEPAAEQQRLGVHAGVHLPRRRI